MPVPRTEADVERLLAHAGWLGGLARRLVRDEATANDLVQDTWHAALRAPPQVLHSERGWLATMLSNLARARARGEGARRRRELSVAAAELIDGPDRLVERAEAQRNLLAVVLELDEPYRSTVLARYAQGESSAEIARRTRVNESTVRTRLARAHEQLRERLARSGGGLAALMPIVDGFRPTPVAALAGTSKGTLALVGAGAGIMGLALKVGVAAAIGLCAWATWHACAPRGEQLVVTPGVEETAPREVLDATGESTNARVPLAASEPVPAPAPVIKAEPAKPAAPADSRDKTMLGVKVTRDGVPAMGVRVWIDTYKVWPIVDCLDVKAQPPPTARTLDTNRFGAAEFRDLDPKTYTYRIGLGTGSDPVRPTRFVTADIFPGYEQEIRLGTAAVRGKVYDVSGRERPGVGVQVYRSHPDAYVYLAAHTVVDERGEYRVGDLAAGQYEVIMEADGRFDGRGERSRLTIQIKEGEEQTIDFGSPLPATTWSGRLLNAFHEPFRGGGRLELVEEKTQRTLSTPVNEDGRFELAFTPGTWKVTAMVSPAPPTGFDLGTTVLTDRDVHRDLIVPGARLRVRLIEPEGRTNEFRTVSARIEGDDYGIRHGLLDADGLRIIDGLGPGRWILQAFPGHLEEGIVPVTIGPDQTVVDVIVHWTAK